MEIKRTTEVFVETRKRWVITASDGSGSAACPECGEPMLAAEQTAVVLELSRRTVYQLVENGTAHFAETETGILLVCPISLREYSAHRMAISGEESCSTE